MVYRVSFKGSMEDEILSDEVGAAVYKDWQEGKLPERVELRPGMTVVRVAIKAIKHERNSDTERPVYTNAELERFERDKLQPFLTNGALTLRGQLEFLRSEGLISWNVLKEPVITISDIDLYVLPHMTGELAKMYEILSQWLHMKGKEAYATKKRLEDYAKMAPGA
jgi:hypothetical protein